MPRTCFRARSRHSIGPLPVEAQWAGVPAASDLVVRFDQTLATGPLIAGAWRAASPAGPPDNLYGPAVAVAETDRVRCSSWAVVGSSFSPNTLSYNAGVGDLQSAEGIAAPDIVNYPIGT